MRSRSPPGSGRSPDDDTGTRFLTGDGDLDRRTVDVLLSTIARVSESRDLEALLIDIVDRSVELCGAERGFLLLVGMALMADAAHFHIPRGYLYFAIAFSILIETLNLIAAGRKKKAREALKKGQAS